VKMVTPYTIIIFQSFDPWPEKSRVQDAQFLPEFSWKPGIGSRSSPFFWSHVWPSKNRPRPMWNWNAICANIFSLCGAERVTVTVTCISIKFMYLLFLTNFLPGFPGNIVRVILG